MHNYREQITTIKKQHLQATSAVKYKWQSYASAANTAGRMSQNNSINQATTVAPLLSTTWAQTTYYNMFCPGGSLTGCVATTMAQIMNYWHYPAKGIGSNTIPNFRDPSYGTLSANFGATTYNWSSMPSILSSSSGGKQDSAVATLMYDCGVSVNMSYGTSASSAELLLADGYSFCAQAALVQYFNYDPMTVNGVQRTDFTDSVWISIIKNELDYKRPVAYEGIDVSAGAGHAWVCDGYQADSLFHMNWGWNGSYNGYFALSSLNVAGYNLNSHEGALIGIKPPFGAQFTATPLVACSNVTVQFTDQSTSTGTINGRKWLFPGGTPSSTTLQNPSVTYSSDGIYDVTEIVNSSTGTDTLVKSAYIVVQSPAVLPLSEAFQESTFPPQGWYLYNPLNYNYTWQQNTIVGGYGKSSKCLFFDNCTANQTVYGQRQQIFSPSCNFSGISNPKMWFDVAYAPYSKQESDTLAVYSSIDCGKTFTLLYLKGGMNLGTAGDSISGTSSVNTTAGGCFLPLARNWRTDTVDLKTLAGQNNVMFAFENRSGYGSDLYIDNIAIPNKTISTSVPETTTENGIKLFPNPTNSGNVSLIIQNSTIRSQLVAVMDIVGKTIVSYPLSSNQSTLDIDISNYPKGIYFVRVISSNGIGCSKLIKN